MAVDASCHVQLQDWQSGFSYLWMEESLSPTVLLKCGIPLRGREGHVLGLDIRDQEWKRITNFHIWRVI